MVEQVLTEPDCDGRCRKKLVGFVAVVPPASTRHHLCRRGYS